MTFDSSTSTNNGSATQEARVSRWIRAFNRRDLDDLLALLHPDGIIWPLRFVGIESNYHGHDGARSWFSHLAQGRYSHQIDLREVVRVPDGRTLATGAVHDQNRTPESWAASSSTTTWSRTPFSGLFGFRDGMIDSARHYFSHDTILEQLQGPGVRCTTAREDCAALDAAQQEPTAQTEAAGRPPTQDDPPASQWRNAPYGNA